MLNLYSLSILFPSDLNRMIYWISSSLVHYFLFQSIAFFILYFCSLLLNSIPTLLSSWYSFFVSRHPIPVMWMTNLLLSNPYNLLLYAIIILSVFLCLLMWFLCFLSSMSLSHIPYSLLTIIDLHCSFFVFLFIFE